MHPISAGPLDLGSLLVTSEQPFDLLSSDLAAQLEADAVGLAKDHREITLSRALRLLANELTDVWAKYTAERNARSDEVGKLRGELAAARGQIAVLTEELAAAQAGGPAIPATHSGSPEPHAITLHEINGCNRSLHVQALDGRGPGGASHLYEIAVLSPAVEVWVDAGDHSKGTCLERGSILSVLLPFQKGPVNEVGVGCNGITHESVLAILLHRLDGFQSGPYACPENAKAREHLWQALDWLNQRTLARESRGVEGTHTP